MAKKISELPAAGAVVDTDELELNQSGTSRKATRAQIVAGLANATHVHTLAEVTDAGALAAKDIVAGADLEDAAVTTAKLADLSVSGLKLAGGAVTTAKLAANAVTGAEIAADAVGAGQLQDGAVTTAKIAADAVGTGQLADNAVTAAKIADGAVTANEIAANAVGSDQLASDAVTTTKIADAAVTMAKIAAGAVDSGQLVDGAVNSLKIASNAVTAIKIATGAVGSTKLADGAVTDVKIGNGAVSTAKIAVKAVGPGQLADTAVTPGVFTLATIQVDQQGRITAASSGTAGESNTGSNIGIDGVGVFVGKSGADLQFRHIAPGSNKVSVTLNGEDIDVDVVEGNLLIPAGNVAGLGALATKDTVEEADIAADAVTTAKLEDLAVTGPKIAGGAITSAKIAAKAVGPAQLEDTAVTPGVYTVATITVDQQGRITAASSGTSAGEANTGSNVGADGVGVFAGKDGVDLEFRHVAPGSNKVSVTLNGEDIDIDVVEGNLLIAAGNVTGLAAVATVGTLAALTSLDADGGSLTNYLAAQDSVSGAYTFVQSDTGREKVFTGAAPATWTIPALSAGSQAVVHNIGTAAISFAASGVTLKGLTTLAADMTAAVSWLPGNVVKLTGELS